MAAPSQQLWAHEQTAEKPIQSTLAPTAQVLCVNDNGEATGAPRTNGTALATIQAAVNAAASSTRWGE